MADEMLTCLKANNISLGTQLLYRADNLFMKLILFHTVCRVSFSIPLFGIYGEIWVCFRIVDHGLCRKKATQICQLKLNDLRSIFGFSQSTKNICEHLLQNGKIVWIFKHMTTSYSTRIICESEKERQKKQLDSEEFPNIHINQFSNSNFKVLNL